MSTLHQRSFAGGEITPSLISRADTTKVQSGLRTCRNNMIMRYGGSQSRPGTTLTTLAKNTTGTVKLIPFIQGLNVSYVLEFGDGYVRFIKNGIQVNVSGVTAWSSSITYAPGNIVSLSGVNYYCILGNLNHTPPNATYWYPMTGSIFELPSPYLTSDLPNIKFDQAVNKLVLVHPNYPPQILLRSSDLLWTFGPIVIGPTCTTPSPTVLPTLATGSATDAYYAVTAVDSTGDESAAGFYHFHPTGGFPPPSPNTPVPVSGLSLSANTVYCNFYRAFATGTIYGYIGSADVITGVAALADIGADPDFTNRPPTVRNPFAASGDYPSVVAFSQQRLIFASTINNPESVWTSRTGSYFNFDVSSLSQDDDSVSFTLSGKQLNTVNNIVELGTLALFTPCAEMSVGGDQNGLLKPSAVNLKTQGLNGSSQLRPLVVDGNLVFVQARGSVVRDLFYQLQIDGYRGNEVSIFSDHLIRGFTLTDWAYQQIPHSIIWAVRSDGVLLGLTYVKEQQLIAWHRHDFSGTTYQANVEGVVSVPEGGYDAVYIAVRRYVNGAQTLMIERMAQRFIPEPALITPTSNVLPWPSAPAVDFCGVDSSLTFDGRTQGSMQLTGGTTWDYTETLTLTAAIAVFTNADVGHQFVLNLSTNGPILRFTVTGYTSTTVVTGNVDRTVPVNMRSTSLPGSSRAVQTVTGLSHLEGEKVSVYADGFVVASPNNPNYPTYTVTSGSLTLDKCYSVIRVGLPITADLETLPIDAPQGESMVNKKKIMTELTVTVEKTPYLFAGEQNPDAKNLGPLFGLTEMKMRQYEGYDLPMALAFGPQEITIQNNTWNTRGSVFIRQVDPVPMSILSIAGDGLIPFGAG